MRARVWILLVALVLFVAGATTLLLVGTDRVVAVNTGAADASALAELNAGPRRFGGGFTNDPSYPESADFYRRAAFWLELSDQKAGRVATARKPRGVAVGVTPPEAGPCYCPSGDRLLTWRGDALTVGVPDEPAPTGGYSGQGTTEHDADGVPVFATRGTYTLAAVYGHVTAAPDGDPAAGVPDAVAAAVPLVELVDGAGNAFGLFATSHAGADAVLMVSARGADGRRRAHLYAVPAGKSGQASVVGAQYQPAEPADTDTSGDAPDPASPNPTLAPLLLLNGVAYHAFASHTEGAGLGAPEFTGRVVQLRVTSERFALGSVYAGAAYPRHLVDQALRASRAHWVNHYMNPVVVLPAGHFARGAKASETAHWLFAAHEHDPTVTLRGPGVGAGHLKLSVSDSAEFTLETDSKLPFAARQPTFRVALRALRDGGGASFGYPAKVGAGAAAVLMPRPNWSLERDPAWLRAAAREWQLRDPPVAGATIDAATGVVTAPARAALAFTVALVLDGVDHVSERVSVRVEDRGDSTHRLTFGGTHSNFSRLHVLPGDAEVVLGVAGPGEWAALSSTAGTVRGASGVVLPRDTAAARVTLQDAAGAAVGRTREVAVAWPAAAPRAAAYKGGRLDLEVRAGHVVSASPDAPGTGHLDGVYRYTMRTAAGATVGLADLGVRLDAATGRLSGAVTRAPRGFVVARSELFYGPRAGELVVSGGKPVAPRKVADLSLRVTGLRPFVYGETGARPRVSLPGVRYRLAPGADERARVDRQTGEVTVTDLKEGETLKVAVSPYGEDVIDARYTQTATLHREVVPVAQSEGESLNTTCECSVETNFNEGFATSEIYSRCSKGGDSAPGPKTCECLGISSTCVTGDPTRENGGLSRTTGQNFLGGICAGFCENDDAESGACTHPSIVQGELDVTRTTKDDLFRRTIHTSRESTSVVVPDVSEKCSDTTVTVADTFYNPRPTVEKNATAAKKARSSVASLVESVSIEEAVSPSEALVESLPDDAPVAIRAAAATLLGSALEAREIASEIAAFRSEVNVATSHALNVVAYTIEHTPDDTVELNTQLTTYELAELGNQSSADAVAAMTEVAPRGLLFKDLSYGSSADSVHEVSGAYLADAVQAAERVTELHESLLAKLEEVAAGHSALVDAIANEPAAPERTVRLVADAPATLEEGVDYYVCAYEPIVFNVCVARTIQPQVEKHALGQSPAVVIDAGSLFTWTLVPASNDVGVSLDGAVIEYDPRAATQHPVLAPAMSVEVSDVSGESTLTIPLILQPRETFSYDAVSATVPVRAGETASLAPILSSDVPRPADTTIVDAHLAGGSLPAGLTLNSDATITGTPTREAVGRHSVTVVGSMQHSGGEKEFDILTATLDILVEEAAAPEPAAPDPVDPEPVPTTPAPRLVEDNPGKALNTIGKASIGVMAASGVTIAGVTAHALFFP